MLDRYKYWTLPRYNCFSWKMISTGSQIACINRGKPWLLKVVALVAKRTEKIQLAASVFIEFEL